MTATKAISKVAVIGGGITAWSTAAALKYRIPCLDVELVSTPSADLSLADRMISTLPSICGFHQDLGLSDDDTIARANSGVRLGTLLDGWAVNEADFVHSYSPAGTTIGGVAFHQLWLRDRHAENLLPFDHFSSAAIMARLGKEPQTDSPSCTYGLQLDLDRYPLMMRTYALHLGVRTRSGSVRGVKLRSDGFVDEVVLEGEAAAQADLFVDCSGACSLVHRHMGSPFIDWSRWLPCDRLAFRTVEAQSDVRLLDRVSATSAGWRWRASGLAKGSVGSVYSSAHAEGSDELSREPGFEEPVAIRQGRSRDLWVRNCLAIGDCAISVEPLEWTNLHLVHSQIDRLVSMMPGCDFSELELGEFNRECAAEADRVRDFICMHYVCSAREESFWKDAASLTPPSSLEHTLSLFAERGRLPYYQEETFSQDSWLTLLLGIGVRPRRVDALADLVPRHDSARSYAAMARPLSLFQSPDSSAESGLNPRGVR